MLSIYAMTQKYYPATRSYSLFKSVNCSPVSGKLGIPPSRTKKLLSQNHIESVSTSLHARFVYTIYSTIPIKKVFNFRKPPILQTGLHIQMTIFTKEVDYDHHGLFYPTK